MERAAPISSGIPLADEAHIQYQYNAAGEPTGLFSFTYYVSSSYEPYVTLSKGYTYADGIELYIKMLESSEIWRGWRIIIYTDEQTLRDGVAKAYGKTPEQHEARKRKFLELITTHPRIILGIVRWDQYKANVSGTSVQPQIMRAFRIKAFDDFPNIPVFLRDADTLFVVDERGRESHLQRDLTPDTLHDWEYEYYRGLEAKGSKYRFCLATEHEYSRDWHVPENLPQYHNAPRTKPSMLGFYAGLVGSLGRIEEWKRGNLWKRCIDYMVGKCKIETRKNRVDGVNYEYIEFVTTRYPPAMDEPILAYVILPELYDTTFFFMYNLVGGYGIDLFRSYRLFPYIESAPQPTSFALITRPPLKMEYTHKEVLNALEGFKSSPSAMLKRRGIYGNTNANTFAFLDSSLKSLASEENAVIRAKASKNVEGYIPFLEKMGKQRMALELAGERIEPALLEAEREAEREEPELWEAPRRRLDKKSPAASVRYAFKTPLLHIFLQRLVKYLMDVNQQRLVCTLSRRRSRRLNRSASRRPNSNSNSNSNTESSSRGRTRRGTSPKVRHGAGSALGRL